MVNTTYKISPVIVFVHSDVLFRGRERVKEGGRLKKHFLLMEIAFRFTASNVAVLTELRLIWYEPKRSTRRDGPFFPPEVVLAPAVLFVP